jgi:hypothetical protein
MTSQPSKISRAPVHTGRSQGVKQETSFFITAPPMGAGPTSSIATKNEERRAAIRAKWRSAGQRARETALGLRVSGLSCLGVLREHRDAVTGVAVVRRTVRKGTHGDGDAGTDEGEAAADSQAPGVRVYLLSVGMDRRLCLWRYEASSPALSKAWVFSGAFRSKVQVDGSNHCLADEAAADGAISDVVYCAERNQFAYASADRCVYVRRFSTNPGMMKLEAKCIGHNSEVTCVRWSKPRGCWVSGCEDGEIRLWSGTDGTCVLTIRAWASIGALCIDQRSGWIIAGVGESVGTFDGASGNVLRVNTGHGDAIRSVMLVAEREQVVSASWDRTIRIWSAHSGNAQFANSVLHSLVVHREETARPAAAVTRSFFTELKPYAEEHPLIPPASLMRSSEQVLFHLWAEQERAERIAAAARLREESHRPQWVANDISRQLDDIEGQLRGTRFPGGATAGRNGGPGSRYMSRRRLSGPSLPSYSSAAAAAAAAAGAAAATGGSMTGAGLEQSGGGGRSLSRRVSISQVCVGADVCM